MRGALRVLFANNAPRRVAAAAIAGLALLLCAAAAAATPPPPGNLEVQGGEDAWHADRSFRLRWRNPPGVAAVRYLVRDSLGSIAAPPQRLGWAATEVDSVEVPNLPGTYVAKVWLEDSAGEQGPAAEAKLHFDDARPAPVEPLPAETWVGRTDFPLSIQLRHSAGGDPLSGLRGFAVSVDRTPGAEPCAAADRCSDGETDLQGSGNDSFPIAELPEGTSYAVAVAVSGAGIRSAATGRAVLRVDKADPAVSLSGTMPGWSNRPLALVATASDGGSGMQPGAGGVAPFTAIQVDGSRPVVVAGDSASVGLATEGIHAVSYYARDLAGNVGDGGSSNGIANGSPQTATVRIDRTPPRVSFAGAQDPLEPETIRARVADELSGRDGSRGWIGIRRAGSGDAFAPLPTGGTNGELRAHWDSDSYPAGEYEFEATGYDLAGNAALSSRRTDGAAMILSNPLKAKTAVIAAFGGRSRGRRVKRTVPYGRRVLLGGRLQDGAGSPLGGSRPVQVIESYAGGSQAPRTSTVWTDPGGGFAFRLPPGPSREVRVAFAGSPTLTRSGSGPLELGVRSVVRLHASAAVARIGGAPLVFSGQVEAGDGTIPATGKSVELQFRLPGLSWSEFRTVQTDHSGRFHYAYRFSDDDSRGARFQFRAYAPAQEDWPYEPGGSLPVLVRGV